MNTEIDNKPFERGRNLNYLQIVDGSQYYTDLGQIHLSLQMLQLHCKAKEEFISNIQANENYEILHTSSLQKDIEYILKGIKNTIEQGYKMYNSNLNTLEPV